MSLAVSFSSFWGWVSGIFRRRKEIRKEVSLDVRVCGSVKRKVSSDGVGMTGVVLSHVEKRVDVVGENFTAVVLDLLGVI